MIASFLLLPSAIAAAAPVVVARFRVPEARQGVAVSATRFYAIDNSRIAAYDKRTGRRLASWTGDPARFPHINSCGIAGPDLVCAASNYPAVPMLSSVETFDAATLRHMSSRGLPGSPGSLTWIVRHQGAWWAGFANYDGRGGEPTRDHRATRLVRYDDAFRPADAWRFPATVLARFAPYGTSGGDWGRDGLLHVTGHDRREVYRLTLPIAGTTLVHVDTLPVSTGGQGIAFDPATPGLLWSIDRRSRRVVETRLPMWPRSRP